MNVTTEILEGTLKPDGTLELDQTPRLDPGRVRVSLQHVLPQTPGQGLAEVIDAIQQDQQARGFKGRTAEQIAVGLHEGEDEYEQRMQALRP